MVLTLKKKKDDKKMIKMFSLLIIVVFVSSIFIIFAQDNTVQTQEQFYLKIQVKDYTNPLQGNVIFVEGHSLEEVLSAYNILINETCINLDYLYCNDEDFTWNLYINEDVRESIEYYPENNDQIIFKYERV